MKKIFLCVVLIPFIFSCTPNFTTENRDEYEVITKKELLQYGKDIENLRIKIALDSIFIHKHILPTLSQKDSIIKAGLWEEKKSFFEKEEEKLEILKNEISLLKREMEEKIYATQNGMSLKMTFSGWVSTITITTILIIVVLVCAIVALRHIGQ